MWPTDIPEFLIAFLLIASLALVLWQFRLKHRHR